MNGAVAPRRVCSLGAVLWTLGLSRPRAAWPCSNDRRLTTRSAAGDVHTALEYASSCRRSPCCAWLADSWQVRRGLSAVRAAARAARGVARRPRAPARRSYPAEVQPLVDDLNALLDAPRAGGAARAWRRPAISRTGSRRRSPCSRTRPSAPGRRASTTSPRRFSSRSTACAGSRLSPRARARRGLRRDRPAGACRSANPPRAWSRTLERLHADAASRIDVDVAPDHAVLAASAKTSTRCSATCSTTPAGGRGRGSSCPSRGRPTWSSRSTTTARARPRDARGGAPARRARGRVRHRLRPWPCHRPRSRRAVRRIGDARGCRRGGLARRVAAACVRKTRALALAGSDTERRFLDRRLREVTVE